LASTGSELAARLLGRWEETVNEIVKVMPRDYRRVLEATRRAVEAGGSVDDEIMAAAHG
jgi:glutamate synthase (NADPH/NADH) large chain